MSKSSNRQKVNQSKATPRKETGRKSKYKANVALDPKQPIPFETPGVSFQSFLGQDYIPFLNPKDNFFSTLLGARLLSTTHNLCIISKVDYCLGTGLRVPSGEDKKFTAWAERVNAKGDSLNDLIKKILDNYFTYGNVFIQPVRTETKGVRGFHINVIPTLDCRLASYDRSERDQSDSVIISPYFRQEGIYVDEDSVKIPIYENTITGRTKTWKRFGKSERTMLHIKSDMAGYDDYGMPKSIASLPQQILEYKASRFNIDAFENDLMIGGAIIMEGNVDEQEATRIAHSMVKTHAGDGKRQRWVALSSEEGVEKIKIVPFEKQLDGSFIELDKRMEAKIIAANEWDALLAGINIEGGLGKGSGWLRTIFNIKNATVIMPTQSLIINKVIIPVLEMADEWLGTSWASQEFVMKTPLPVLFSGDIDTNSVLTVDEGRKELGVPEVGPEKGGDMFISQVPKQKNDKGGGDVQKK